MSKLPATSFSLARYLRQQARTQQRLVQSSAFTNSGISVTADGVSTVDGSLVLPAGSIPDGALANPSTREVAYLTATGFAPTATWVEVTGVDLIVPPGASRLLLHATAWVYATNNTAAADDLHVRVSLGLVDGQAFLTPLLVAGYGTVSAGLATLAEALAVGSTIRLSTSVKTTTGTWTVDAANTGCLSATLTWVP